MTAIAIDTNVVVAALLTWHDRHVGAHRALSTALAGEDRILLPAPVLLESYAVMTRLPAPHRIAPSVARELLHGSFHGRVEVVHLSGAEAHWNLLDHLAETATAGGTSYDAHIIACLATRAPVRLWTYNERHLAALAGEGVEVEEPG